MVMGEGWLIDSDDRWIWRFHRDQKGWINEPKVFIDRDHLLPDGPPLPKERRHLRKAEAEQLLAPLQTLSWKCLASPACGDGVEL